MRAVVTRKDEMLKAKEVELKDTNEKIVVIWKEMQKAKEIGKGKRKAGDDGREGGAEKRAKT